MLKQTLIYTSIICSALTSTFTAGARDFGSDSEARGMLARALAEVKADKTRATAKFNHNEPGFRDRDLFVFCFNRDDGKLTAHEAMVGWDVRNLYDIWGSPFGEEMFNSARHGQITEVIYLSPMPGTIGLTPKRAFVTAIGDQTCGVSAYQLDGQTSTH